mmetsp:Transcript_123729/g.332315  ORF Transcript_123729/g.332315 Transcript_123729/m.332315 type:complete len:291 (-) Transcript_123729:252-1124(-)
MSSPRAATSVPTSTLMRPCFRSLRAASRCCWSLSPWIAAHGTPLRSRLADSWSHILLEPQKINPLPRPPRTFRPASMRISASMSSFLFAGTMRTSCVTSAFPFSSSRSPTMTLYGFVRISDARLWISRGQVAVKNSVCLFEGRCSRILRICGSNPMSSILSASSSTSLLVFRSCTCRPSRKSLRRPGHATTHAHPCRYLDIWLPLGAPPYIATHLICRHFPNLFPSASVCCASSRVGDITSSPGPSRSGRAPCSCISTKAGIRNASVFPLPVLAMPIRSLPAAAMAQVCA